MSVIPIITLGHPTLRKQAEPITEFDQELKNLVQDMIETMRLNEGIGLAAPQVNILKQLFVIDKQLIDENLEAEAYINPEIKLNQNSETMEEGCLSIPGVRADVIRPSIINVKYQNLSGKVVEEQLDVLLARVFLHELDHLKGILFIDHISALQKKLLEPKLRELEGVYNYS